MHKTMDVCRSDKTKFLKLFGVHLPSQGTNNPPGVRVTKDEVSQNQGYAVPVRTSAKAF